MDARRRLLEVERLNSQLQIEVSNQHSLKTDSEAKDEKLRLIMNSTVDAIISIDEYGVIESANPAVESIFGLTIDEVIGQNVSLLMSDPEHSQHDSYLKKYTDTGQIAFMGSVREVNGKRKDGSLVPLELSVSEVISGGRRTYTGVIRDVSERKQQEQTIERQANFDKLTGLPNRALFQDRLKGILSQSRRRSEQVGLLFIDLDGFKKVNDTLGHQKGDILLRMAADRLQGIVRESDTVAHMGGDEFTIILSELHDGINADHVAQKIITSLSEPFLLDGEQRSVGASVGIAISPDDGDSLEQLVRNADTALDQAKGDGKNCYRFFTPEMDARARAKLNMETELGVALERNEFILLYQPIIDIRENRCVGFEALIRWNHSSKGFIAPVEFIPIAEENGIISGIGNWVLQEACAQLKKWRNSGFEHCKINVNVSPKQFENSDFRTLFSRLIGGDVNLTRGIVMEITESLYLGKSNSDADTLLSAWRSEGAGIALDDFGTGYSSLSYLKEFSFDILKIDRSFLDDVASSHESRVLIQAIITMAHALNIKVVAEGVETELQLNTLRNLGCDFAQGYLFSKPVAPDQAIKFLAVKNDNSGELEWAAAS